MDNQRRRDVRTLINTLLTFCTINICGLSSRSLFTLDKYSYDNQFDFIAVQETGTRRNVEITNMNYITDDNQARNKGSMIYINKKHTITKLTSLTDLSKHIDTTWGLAIMNGKRYIVGSVYLKLNYISGIEELLDMLNNAYDLQKRLKVSGVIVCGDFNARHSAWGDHVSNDYGKRLLEKIDHQKFSIHTSNTPSFVAANGGSFIDLMIVSNNMNMTGITCNTDEEAELFSGAPLRGHLPVITKISSGSAGGHTTAQEPKETINIDNINWDNWSQDLENKVVENNNVISSTEDPHKLWEITNNIIKSTTMQHAEKKISTSHSKPYWTEELSELSKNLRVARKSYNLRNTDPNKEKMIEVKNEFDEKRKKACSDFIMGKTKDLNSIQAQRFWKKFKALFSNRSDGRVEPLKEENGNILSNNEEIEETLFETFFKGKHLEIADFDNEFFEEVNKMYEDIINEEPDEENTTAYTYDINKELTIAEIQKLIKAYTAGDKSLDKDHFHPKMFKHLGIKALDLLKKLFNLCLTSGKWVWDKADVIFLKKEGKDTYSKPGSYRPISITSYIGKLMEKIIANRITGHQTRTGKNDKDQEGFSVRRNTVRYLYRLKIEIKVDKNNKKTIIVLFIDFEKAFDSVWKKGLIVKLRELGVKGNILKLIDNFLMSRTVALHVNGHKGPTRKGADVGVPQGSALSPLLFKIFLMDLGSELENIEGVTKLKFADDGSIKVAESTTEKCLETFETVLTVIHNWSRKWRMGINCLPNKTEVIQFNTAENDENLIPKTFKLGVNEIKRVKRTTVLGLVIDEDLKFIGQSDKVEKKLQARWITTCQFCNKNWGFNQRVMTQLLKTLFLSCLFYAGHVWINSNNIKEIEKLWYKMIKSAVGAVFNVSQTIAEIILGIPPLQIINQINKIKHHLKLNMNNEDGDRLTSLITKTVTEEQTTPVELVCALKETLRFLKWKGINNQISAEDSEIINNNNIQRFFDISPEACKYTKKMMTEYTEFIWKKTVTNYYQANGKSIIPTPSCKPLALKHNTTRKNEVTVMSLFYDNNLMNNFLYQRSLCESPTCPACGEDEQTPYHAIVKCGGVDEIYRTDVKNQLVSAIGEELADIASSVTLLNASRSRNFMDVCTAIVESGDFRTDIEL